MSRLFTLFFVLFGMISAAPQSASELIGRSVQLQSEGKLPGAAALMRELLARPGLSPLAEGLALNELGLAQHSRNQFDEAERTYLRAIRVLEGTGLRPSTWYEGT